MIAAPSVSYTARRRGDSFLARCRLRGVEVQLLAIAVNDYPSGYEIASRLAPMEIDGVFCANDYTACGVLDRLMSGRSRDDGHAIRVIGHDDIPQASWAAYQLTTIRQPCDIQAEQTIDLLISRMAEPDMTARVEFTPVSLIKRRTA
jgi:DNA-binding LacI/PurR family transcriptional regulator